MQPRRMVFPSALVLSVYVKFKLLLDFVQVAHLIDDLAVPAVASVPTPINMAKTRNGLILFFFEAIPPIPRIF